MLPGGGVSPTVLAAYARVLPSTVRRVHAKFLGSGKLTFEIDAGKQGTKQLMVSKASVDDLKGILGTLDTAAKHLFYSLSDRSH